MVAPAEDNIPKTRGAFGDPLSISHGVQWTQRELRALKWRARFGSVGNVVRSMIGTKTMERLVRDTEAERRKSATN